MQASFPSAPWNIVETAIRLAWDPIRTLHKAKEIVGGNFILKSVWGPAYVVCDPEVVNALAKDFNWNIVQKDPVTEASPDPLKQFGGDFNVTSDGYFHKHYRDLLKTQFTHSRLKNYADQLLQSFVHYTQDWCDADSIEFSQRIGEITLDVICKGILDIELTDEERRHIRKTIDRIYTIETQYIILGKIATSSFSPYASSYRSMTRRMRGILNSKVEKVSRCPFSAGYVKDFLQRNAADHSGEVSVGRKKLIDDMLGLTVAGLDTVNVATTWAVRIVLENPEIICEIRKEADAVFGEKEIKAEDYKKLMYSRCVVLETLRLYPPFPLIIKQTVDEMVIDNTFIPSKSWMFFLAYSMQRDSTIFESPEIFAPSRWFADSWGLEHPGFLPFGAGTHRCQGWELALLEASMLVSLLFFKFDIQPLQKVGHQPIDQIPFDYRINMFVRGGLPLQFTPRS